MSAALKQLCDVAREKGHDRANRFAIILRQTRPLMGSPTFQQVLLKLLGSDEEVATTKEIQKAVKQTPGVCPRAPASLPDLAVTRQTNSVLCFNCGRWGHIARSCWRPQNLRNRFRGGKIGLRWLKTVSSTYIWMGRYNHSLSLDATIMVSKKCPITGEHVFIIFLTQ